MKTVGIIIPVFNGETYIARAIDSILASSIAKFAQIIIVDDGSTDKTQQICENYAKTNSILYKRLNKNKGVSYARNFGIKVSQNSDYIGFLDADDIWCLNLPYNTLDSILANDVDLINFSYALGNEAGTSTVIIHPSKADTEFVEDNFFSRTQKYKHASFCSFLYKTELLLSNNIVFPEGLKLCEDINFKEACLYAANKITECDSCNFIYCDSSNSTMKQPHFINMLKGLSNFDSIRAREQMMLYHAKMHPEDSEIQRFYKNQYYQTILDAIAGMARHTLFYRRITAAISQESFFNDWLNPEYELLNAQIVAKITRIKNHPNLFCLRIRIAWLVRTLTKLILPAFIVSKIKLLYHRGISTSNN